MRYRPEQVGAACQLLSSAAGQIREKSGCCSCHVGGDLLDPDVVWYAEEWASEDSLQRNVRSEDFFRVLVAMDMAVVEPEVRVGQSQCRSGMDVLRALCARPEA